MSLAFVIHPGSSTPIYRQLTDQVRLAIATGKVAVGDPLPSVRALAETLVINPNTVARAYADLARESLVETRAGRGVFIAQKRRVFSREEAWRRLNPALDSLVGEAMAMDVTREELRAAFEEKLKRWKNPR